MISMKLVSYRVDLKKVKRSLQARGVKRAIKTCIPPVVEAVRSAASRVKRYGFLAKSISFKIKAYKNAVVGIIGPLSKFKRRKGVRKRGKFAGDPIYHRPAYYAHLVERGSYRSKAKPFLRPARMATRASYRKNVAEQIAIEIRAEFDKQRKK